jgi:hypothetical protein
MAEFFRLSKQALSGSERNESDELLPRFWRNKSGRKKKIAFWAPFLSRLRRAQQEKGAYI